MRMRILGPPATHAQLRRAVAGVAMLLPQGDALCAISTRLSVASNAFGGAAAGGNLGVGAAPRSGMCERVDTNPILTQQRLEHFIRLQEGRRL